MADDRHQEPDRGADRGPRGVPHGAGPSAGPIDADLTGLLVAASLGQESAWRELLNRYSRRVFALIKSRCRDVDMAEELTQSVFVTIASKLGEGLYTEQGRFESWLFRITMNRVRDHARRLRRQATATDSEGLIRERPAPSVVPSGPDSRLAGLRGAMEQLSDTDREVIELRHHGGLSFKQMAELLGEPVGTLLARHHRALKKLKDWMEGESAGAHDRGSDQERT